MAVRIVANQLRIDGLELDLPGASTRLVLGPSGGVSGTYDQDAERLALRALRAERFLITQLTSALAQGELRLEAPCQLDAVSVDGELRGGAGFTGEATVGSATVERVHLEVGGWQMHAKLELGQLGFSASGSGSERVRIEHLHLRDVALENGSLQIGVRHVALAALELRRAGDGGTALGAASAAIEGITVERGGATATLDDVKLPSGVRFEGGGLELAALELGKLALDVPDLTSLGSGGTGAARSAPPAAAAKPRAGGPPSLPFLDHLQGNLQLDVEVELRLPLPIIKARKATHRVRLPIDGGRIDYKQLESSLSGLENAVLDFEISDAGLILERDLIPGVSFDNQTLVTWPLPPEELEVARRERRVRLRRLFDYQLDPKLQGDASKETPDDGGAPDRPGPLRRLDITNIDVSLSVNAASELALGDVRLRLGAGVEQALRRLRLQGEVHIASEEDRGPSDLRLELDDLRLGAEAPLGARRLHVGELHVGRIDEAVLQIQRLRPGRLSVRAGRLGAANVRVSPPQVNDGAG